MIKKKKICHKGDTSEPKLYNWMKDGFPPVSSEFFCYKNARELLDAYVDQKKQITEMREVLQKIQETDNVRTLSQMATKIESEIGEANWYSEEEVNIMCRLLVSIQDSINSCRLLLESKQ